MSRIRSVHPGFFTDEDLVSVSMAARLLFIGIGVEADDKGIFEWKPLTIKMRVFPADNIDCAALLEELSAIGAIRKYEIGGRHFGAIRNFRRFQKPKTPNDIHPATPQILAFVGMASVEPEAFPPNGETFPPKGEITPQMEDGGGKREEEEELSPNGDCASGDALKPEHVVEVWNATASQIGKPKVRDLTPERRQLLKARIAQYSLDDFQSVFGKIGGSPFLRGDTGWRGCTFDWIFKKANFQKVLEGNYDG